MIQSTLRCLLALGLSSVAACAAREPVSEGERLLAEAVAAMRSEALGRENVDWDALESRLRARLPRRATAGQAEPLIREAIAELGDPHARYSPPAPVAAAGADASSAPDRGAPAHPPIPPTPVGRMLDGSIAYILMPMCAPTSGEEPARYARETRALIGTLSAESPRAWIIDLRLNGGGNVWPMLLGLSPLIGDGPQMSSIVGGAPRAVFGVSGNTAWLESGGVRAVQLALAEESVEPISAGGIAILLGPWTMSSGEALAIVLRSMPGVRSFGEATAGLTTVTQTYTLSDGSLLFLPVSVMGDRSGGPFPAGLTPDVAIRFDEWPSATDGVAAAAREWLIAQSRR